MQYRKLTIILALVIILSILAGCGMVSVNPEKDRSIIVAKVKGKNILKGEVLDRLDREKAYYNLTADAIEDPNNVEQILEIKKAILDQIVTEELLFQKAEDEGFILTDSLLEEAADDFVSIIGSIEEQMKTMYDLDLDEEGGDGDLELDEDRDYSKEAEDYIMNLLEDLGMSEEDYIEYLAKEKCIEKLYDKIVADVAVSDEEIDAFYNEELENQKGNIGFLDNRSIVVHDPFMIRVKHLFIELDEDSIDEYKELSQEDEDKAKDYLEEALAKIEPSAKSYLERAKAGENFEDMALELEMEEGEMMREGLTIHEGNFYLPEEYNEAAFKLELGEVSNLVSTEAGYYIIKLEEEIEEKTYTRDELEDEIYDILEDRKQADLWMETVEAWKEELVEFFHKKL